MSELTELRRRESAAEGRLNEAIKATFLELREAGVGGKALFEQVEERVQPLRIEYEQAKYERVVEERDGRILRRGTWRGVALAASVLCFVWMTQTISEAVSNRDGGMVPIVEESRKEAEIVGEEWVARDEYRRHLFTRAVLLTLGAAVGAAAVWRLGRIPLLGRELVVV